MGTALGRTVVQVGKTAMQQSVLVVALVQSLALNRGAATPGCHAAMCSKS